MKTSLILPALLCCVVLLGAGCAKSTSTIETSTDFNGSLEDALSLGQAMKCTWSNPDGSGTSYVKGGKMYVESVTDGVTGHIVNDGVCSYIWGDGETDGVKFCLAEDATDEVDESENGLDELYNEGMPDDVAVDCARTSVPDSTFTPPTDVTFIDPLEAFTF